MLAPFSRLYSQVFKPAWAGLALSLTLIAAGLLPPVVASAASSAAWALQYEGKSTNSFVWDKRTAPLVRTRVPSRISDQVLDGLGGPPDPVIVTAHRYVSVSACVPHYCPDKGFFWVDTQSGIGLGAAFSNGDKLALGSNGFSATGIPPLARRALMDWINEQDIKPKSVEFFDRAGTASSLAPANFQPRGHFNPPPAGPSFDCSGHLNAVDAAICSDGELKALDRDLAEQFGQMRHGQATVGSRQQLVEFQRAWLKARNAACSHGASVADCLKREYAEQHERLMNWIPAPGN